MNILFVTDDKKGPGFYRMMMPANEIRKANLAAARLVFQATAEDIQWAEIVILQRGYHPSLFEMIDWAKSIGKVIVYELDDYLQGVNPNNPAYRVWNPAGPHLQRAFDLIKRCDAMTVTTDRMQREYAPWNSNIHVLPNFLDRTLFTRPPFKHKDKRIRIGYTGAGAHQDDLQLIDAVITRLCKKYPEVKLVIMGIEPKNAFKAIPHVNYDCPTCKRKGQLEVIKGTEITMYFNKLADQGFDIGIAPLVDNSFNNCKSDLKLREYGALGIPVVASNVYPYRQSLQDKKNGFLVSTADEWFKSLEKLIVNKDLRLKMGKANKEWVDRECWIQDHVGLFVNTYDKILQNVLMAAGFNPRPQ